MKITRDREADAMRIIWNETAQWKANKMIADGYEFLLMIDAEGKPMGLEILSVSHHVSNPQKKMDDEDITRVEAEK